MKRQYFMARMNTLSQRKEDGTDSKNYLCLFWAIEEREVFLQPTVVMCKSQDDIRVWQNGQQVQLRLPMFFRFDEMFEHLGNAIVHDVAPNGFTVPPQHTISINQREMSYCSVRYETFVNNFRSNHITGRIPSVFAIRSPQFLVDSSFKHVVSIVFDQRHFANKGGSYYVLKFKADGHSGTCQMDFVRENDMDWNERMVFI